MHPMEMLGCGQHSIHTQGPKHRGNAGLIYLLHRELWSVSYVPGSGLDAGDNLKGRHKPAIRV